MTLEFAREHEIDRVVWSRDRLGKFRDRLAIRYVMEVSSGETGSERLGEAEHSKAWKVVARSDDRVEFDSRNRERSQFSVEDLVGDEAEQAKKKLAEKRRIDGEITRLDGSRKFCRSIPQADEIHRLLRVTGATERGSCSAVLGASGKVILDNSTAEQQRRAALADWIASPHNPLTARVMANRIWLGHFGTGLVSTPSDLGNQGARPSHPELLDWLAYEFIRSGWSVKHLHRLIVLSNTYRQASAISGLRSLSHVDLARAADVDAESRYLWRFPSRRLES